MADLISRAAAIAQIKENYCDWCDHTDLCQSCETRDCIATIEQQVPAVDAVPVVRCRDCKYYAINRLTKAYEPDKRFNPSVCIIGEFARPRKPDWYCADGERRDDDAADRR